MASVDISDPNSVSVNDNTLQDSSNCSPGTRNFDYYVKTSLEGKDNTNFQVQNSGESHPKEEMITGDEKEENLNLFVKNSGEKNKEHSIEDEETKCLKKSDSTKNSLSNFNKPDHKTKSPSEVEINPQKTFVMEDDDSHLTAEDGWLDIFGSGDFKKRVIKPGNGQRVHAKNVVKVNYTTYKDNSEVVEKKENFEFIVGDLDVVKGIDLAIPIMEHEETAEILVPSRLAYGKMGRPPEIPEDCNLLYIVEILLVEELDEESLTAVDALKYGNQKRDRGNFWYSRNDYISAIHCYKRAAEFLDLIQDGSYSSSQLLQEILDTRIKVHNNLAAAHLKMESYDQALKAVDFVLKIQSKNVKAHFRRAKILSAKGLTDEAVASLKKAADLEPDTKVIQQELQRLQRKKQIEHKNQQEMYKRMFPQSSKKPKPSSLSRLMKHWSIMAGAGSCVALAVGVAAYRQYYS